MRAWTWTSGQVKEAKSQGAEGTGEQANSLNPPFSLAFDCSPVATHCNDVLRHPNSPYPRARWPMAHSSSSSSSSAAASVPNHPLLGDGEPSLVPSSSSTSSSSSGPPPTQASSTPAAMDKPGSHSEHSSSSQHPSPTTTTTATMTTTATTLLPFPVPPPPAPIPLPEPVHVPPPSTDHAEGATRTSSSQDSPPRPSADFHGSLDLTSSSPKEVNQLLAVHSNNNNNSDFAPLTMGPRRPRPQHVPSSSVNPSIGTRHSAADAYVSRPHSSYSFNGSPQDSRPASVARQRSNQFTPSPLNPYAPRTRPNSTTSRPASMVLYRLAGLGDEELRFQQQAASAALIPPPPIASTGSLRAHRASVYSSTGSIFSEADSKYPQRHGDDSPSTPPPSGRLLPYEYDPTDDLEKPDDAEDELHTPDPVGTREKISAINTRGFANIFVMILLLLGLITLFLGYPIISERNLRWQSSALLDADAGNGSNGGNENQQQTS